jgi:two-component system cell cycle sensor histidine kinase/response regulator CckA
MNRKHKVNRRSEDVSMENDNPIENHQIVLASILDAVPHAVIGMKNRTIVFANPAVHTLFGWHPDELIGRNTRILYCDDEGYEEIGRNFYSMLVEQRTFRQEFPCRRKDGKITVCMVSASRIGDELKDNMIVATYEDITERKHAESVMARSQEEMAILVQKRTLELQRTYAELAREMTMHAAEAASRKEAERRLLDIIEFFPDATLAIDREGKVIIWNQAIEEMTGVKAEDMLGKGDHEYALPFYGVRRPILVDLVFSSDEQIRQEYLFIRKEKEILLTETDVPQVKGKNRILAGKAGPLYDSEGRVVGAIESIRDVTERRQSEEALKASEERYRLFINGTDDMVFMKDEQQRYAFVNRAMADFFEKDISDIIGKTDVQLMPENAARMCRDSDERALQADGVVVTEEDWGERTFESRKFRLNLMNGKIGLGAFIRETTLQKRLESQLVQAQKMEAIGTLAGGIAHDFNNLLMGIQGHASLMLMDIDAAHPHYGRLHGIQDQVQSGANLTRQLLGFARGGRYEIKPTDINQLIRKTSSMFGRTKKEIHIQENYDDKIWTVNVDQTQMEQVFLNLYVNAWQAMPAGGNLYLETGNIVISQDTPEAFPRRAGKYVKISVKDTGVGMDDNTRRRIFEPFFTTKEMGRGTGLGLATVYGIIKGHGGFIDVFSEEGKGTCFVIYLPAANGKAAHDFRTDGRILRGRETILLVDDEAVIIDVSRDILEALGYRVLSAAGGRQAVQIYEEAADRIDLVILDMIMPDMGGGETFDRLKLINPDIKVILSSGYSMNSQAKIIMEKGVQAFLQKPFRIDQFSQKIRDVLGD